MEHLSSQYFLIQSYARNGIFTILFGNLEAEKNWIFNTRNIAFNFGILCHETFLLNRPLKRGRAQFSTSTNDRVRGWKLKLKPTDFKKNIADKN